MFFLFGWVECCSFTDEGGFFSLLSLSLCTSTDRCDLLSFRR